MRLHIQTTYPEYVATLDLGIDKEDWDKLTEDEQSDYLIIHALNNLILWVE